MIEHFFMRCFPFFLLISLAGWGSVGIYLLKWKLVKFSNFYDNVWIGMWFVTLLGLLINFFIGFGSNSGIFLIVIGFIFFLWNLIRNRDWFLQSMILFSVVALTTFFTRKMGFSYDAGLYHFSTMNWIADGPVPLGLANVENRLGFNSAWLIFVSSLRFDKWFSWKHLIYAEIAIFSLAIAWLLDRILNFSGKAESNAIKYVFIASLFVLLMFYTRITGQTSTDNAANICAFLAGMAFLEGCFFNSSMSSSNEELSKTWIILCVFCVLAISFKISLLPIIGFIFIAQKIWKVRLTNRFINLEFFTIVILFVLVWILRTFLLSGCAFFPLTPTCINQAWWGVPANNVQALSGVITGWARNPGIDYINYTNTWDMSWTAEWFVKFVRTFPAIILLVSFIFWTASKIITFKNKKIKKDNIKIEGESAIVLISLLGIALWFIKAPDPRFSWSLFALLSTVLLCRGLAVFDLKYLSSLNDLNYERWVKISVVLSLGIQFLLPWRIVQIPASSFILQKSANGWSIFRPIEGDQCWAAFPCSPYSVESIDANLINGRWQFKVR